MTRPRFLPPAGLPAELAVVPGFAVPAAFSCLGAALSLDVYGWPSVWFVLGAVLSIVAPWFRRQASAQWLLLLYLTAGQLARPDALSARFLLLLAGLHVLHVLIGLTFALPWSSWVQPRVFGPATKRFVAVQVPSQIVAVIVLLLLAPDQSGRRPLSVAAAGVVGMLALGGLTYLLLWAARNGYGER